MPRLNAVCTCSGTGFSQKISKEGTLSDCRRVYIPISATPAGETAGAE